MVYRVFVTTGNPVKAIHNDDSNCIFKDFDTLEAAYKFACLMLENDLNISLCVWDAEAE